MKEGVTEGKEMVEKGKEKGRRGGEGRQRKEGETCSILLGDRRPWLNTMFTNTRLNKIPNALEIAEPTQYSQTDSINLPADRFDDFVGCNFWAVRYCNYFLHSCKMTNICSSFPVGVCVKFNSNSYSQLYCSWPLHLDSGVILDRKSQNRPTANFC